MSLQQLGKPHKTRRTEPTNENTLTEQPADMSPSIQPLTPDNMLHLQRTVGNHALQRLLMRQQSATQTPEAAALPLGVNAAERESDPLATQTTGALLQRQVAGGIMPNPDPRCDELLQQIRDFLYGNGNMKGLIQRAQELIEDLQGLQWDFWTVPHPEFGSVEGHQQQFRNMQQGLRNRLNEWNTRNCDDPDGPSRLPADAWDWATRPAPAPAPRPRPAAPRVEGEGINWRRVWEVLKAIGLGIALVVVVIAALADPEPASKLALAGLSIVMIGAILSAFGRGGGGGETTA
ncbi:MAG: hypothetical protein HXY40_17260 [Chloroflexi bacterium]|nr:hypothetical protein [Chloroflexota bacterium]